MKLVKISQDDDPSKISQINLKNSLIICTNEINKLISFEERSIFLINPTDIMFSSQKILNNNYTIVNYQPNIRWSIPKDVNITFKEAIEFRNKSYFSNIYTNNVMYNKYETHDLISQNFSIFIDRERSREMGKIKKGERLLEVGIEYKIFAEQELEIIYLIQNNYCFQEFETHFNR